MSKAKIVGGAMVIESALAKKDIEILQELKPEALVLADEGGNQYFRIGTGANGIGSANDFGIVFDSVDNATGEKATVTVALNADGATGQELKVLAAKKYGKVLANLNKVEETVPAALEEARTELASVVASIELI